MNRNNNNLEKTFNLLDKKIGLTPQIAIITGSGINLFEMIKPKFTIKYSDLPIYIKNKHIKGHKGQINLYKIHNKDILVFCGRQHLYQGLDITEVTKNIKLISLLKIKNLLLTNAAGGLNEKFIPGELMLIDGFIDLMQSTERGVLSGIIEPRTKIKTKLTTKIKSFKIKTGTYAGMHGPNYETYSEVMLLRSLKASAVGMSTIPEILAAKSLGINYAGVSVISNVWNKKHKPTHTEVLRNVEKANKKLNTLIDKVILSL